MVDLAYPNSNLKISYSKSEGVLNGKYEFRKTGKKLSIKTWFGVHLVQEGRDIDVYVPGRFMNKLRGVCGNNNDDRTDDYTRCDTAEQLEIKHWSNQWITAKGMITILHRL